MLALLNRLVRPGPAGLGLLVLSVLVPNCRAEEPKPWPFHDGDRIVLVGDTLIERDQRYGYLESELTLANPELNLTFRNLGWSGDTVRGLSRAGFDPPEAGFRELVKQVLAAKPTVLIVGYGMADSFDGEAGLPKFVSGLNQFLDAVASTKARLIFLSPIPHEDLGRPLPDPTEHNRVLALYAEAIRKVAGERGGRFVDLLDLFPVKPEGYPLTDNGIHLKESGYFRLAYQIAFRLGNEAAQVPLGMLAIDGEGKVIQAARQTISDVHVTPGSIRFTGKSQLLAWPDGLPSLRVPGLPAGRFSLKVDGQPVATADASDWAKMVLLRPGPEREQCERLRRTINEKNLLFFHRWRPQNQTYLFGFRKHEQGNNAIEIPEFDPLVAAKEKEIARLRKPVPHVYELIKESEVVR